MSAIQYPEPEPSKRGAATINVDILQEVLRLLAYENRLDLLFQLQEPLTLDEIHLTPGSPRAGGNPDRPISRQSVQHHLAQLVEAGLVQVRTTRRRGKRPLHEYVVDHARLFAVADEFRKISSRRPSVRFDASTTMTGSSANAVPWRPGPKLILVHGVEEGHVFPLAAKPRSSTRGWVVGRRAEADVCLDYDPFVSLENAEIISHGGDFRLVDLRTSRNGTSLNWTRLPVGGDAVLKSGDVIGVGRSLLVFRSE